MLFREEKWYDINEGVIAQIVKQLCYNGLRARKNVHQVEGCSVKRVGEMMDREDWERSHLEHLLDDVLRKEATVFVQRIRQRQRQSQNPLCHTPDEKVWELRLFREIMDRGWDWGQFWRDA